MWFDGWSGLGTTLASGVVAYVALVAFVRISGKRTLAKMNAFDLVVTVTLGSTLSSIVLSRDVSVADGATALALLIGLQFVVSWSSVRWGWFERVVKSRPTLLAYRGAVRRDALVQQRVSEDELHAAVRGAGLAGLRHVGAAVLETDGTISVVAASSIGDMSASEVLRPTV